MTNSNSYERPHLPPVRPEDQLSNSQMHFLRSQTGLGEAEILRRAPTRQAAEFWIRSIKQKRTGGKFRLRGGSSTISAYLM